MQQYTPISSSTKINEAPSILMASLETVLTSSSGNSFPGSNLREGRLCYREDQKTLYLMTDATAKVWKKIIDFNKTLIDAETVSANYIAKSVMTGSLTDGSTSKVATAAATKALKGLHDSFYSEFQAVKGVLNTSAGKVQFVDDVEISKNFPLLHLKSSTLGSNTNEKAAAIQIGSTSATSALFTVSGDGKAYIGVGGLSSSKTPLYTAIRIDPAQTGVNVLGSLTVAGALSAPATSISSTLTVAGAVTANSSLTTKSNLYAVNVIASGYVQSASDARLKTSIQKIENALDKVKRLNGVTYEKKGLKGREVGLIAQEVEKVLPEAVGKDSDYLSLAYGNMVALLVEAIKELSEKVDKYAAV